MHRLSPLLVSMIVLASLLAHHMHAPLTTAEAPVPVAVATAGHPHHGMRELQVIDHGALDDINSELCTIGAPAPPAPSGIYGHVADLTPTAGSWILHPVAPSEPMWETPVLPANVLRAFLQVFLN